VEAGSRINLQSKEWNGGQAKRVKLTPVKECGIPREGGRERRRRRRRRGGGKGDYREMSLTLSVR
jgi:hypothetical protein